MHLHVSDLTQTLANAAARAATDPSFIRQARTIGYIGSKVIYAMGQQARFHDASPYFALPSTPKKRAPRKTP